MPEVPQPTPSPLFHPLKWIEQKIGLVTTPPPTTITECLDQGLPEFVTDWRNRFLGLFKSDTAEA